MPTSLERTGENFETRPLENDKNWKEYLSGLHDLS
jgi:hypothetical protein